MKVPSQGEVTANLATGMNPCQQNRALVKGSASICIRMIFSSRFLIFSLNPVIYLCKSTYFCQFFLCHESSHLWAIFRFFLIFAKKSLIWQVRVILRKFPFSEKNFRPFLTLIFFSGDTNEGSFAKRSHSKPCNRDGTQLVEKMFK